MAIRLSGLNSGMDTDSIVQALMSAQRYKQTKIEAKKTKLEWKQEIWSSLNSKIYNFYKDTLSKIRLQGTYKEKAANSSNSSKVTATASSSASEGTYKVKVNSLASAQYVTSGKLKGVQNEDGTIGKVTSSSKLVDLIDASGNTGFQAGTQISINSASGLSTLLVDENTTVKDFVTACQNAGLTASFDEGQQRFFIGSSTSGADQKFTITATSLSQPQLDAISSWKDAVGYDYLSSTDKAAVSKIFDQLQSGAVTYSDVESRLRKYTEKSQQSAANAYYTKERTNHYNNEYFVGGDSANGITAAGNQALTDAGKDVSTMSEAEKISALKSMVTANTKADLAKDEYKNKIADAAVNGIAGESGVLGNSVDGNMATLASVAGNYQSTMSSATPANDQLAYLGLGEVTGEKVDEVNGDGMVVRAASDASITFNGATLTSSNSTISVNGLTLEVLDTTEEGEEITISVTKDTSAVYDTIKDFISGYNSILTEMNTKYNAASAKGYDVLTDDQKEAMTDDEIEKWEDKIKSSLLRRDDTLNSLITLFRSDMMGTYTASNGKTYSLSSLGIVTSSDYTEKGLLHIKGDEDDAEYMDETNMLEKLLTEDPELVTEIMTGLTSNLYGDLQKKMSATSLSSALTFYNDKEMSSQISDYKKQIAKWEEKLAALEERYYKQFTAMEKAMAQLNSQQNYFSNMFG